MTLEEITERINQSVHEMARAYEKTVFDEWCVVALLDRKARLLAYRGPRKEDFQKRFLSDIGDLRSDLFGKDHNYGDFYFERHAGGTKFDAFMALGEGLYLICNNTSESISDITSDPKWLNAQKIFVRLSEKIRSSPLNYPV